MNIHVPSSTDSRYVITQGMVEDLIFDPVFAAHFFFGIKFDIFQRVRLKMMWYVPTYYGSDGVSSGKTITNFVYACLRAMLLTNYTNGHPVGIYFPTFQIGKDTFWTYFSKLRHPRFQAQLGAVEDPDGSERKAKRRDPGAWSASFKSGGSIQMPAPDAAGDGKNQVSRRYGTVIVEEVTKFDELGNAVDAELNDRASEATFSKNHAIWSVHLKYLGHAETRQHPSWRRYNVLRRKMEAGDPNVHCHTASYKDYSGELDSSGRPFTIHRADNTINLAKANLSADQFLCKYLGIWAVRGAGWYSQPMMENCGRAGADMNLIPMLSAADSPTYNKAIQIVEEELSRE